jgi:hypothetical protein
MAQQRESDQEPGNEAPHEPNVNQVRDEPFPASHHDDGRPEPGEESPAQGAGHPPGANEGNEGDGADG